MKNKFFKFFGALALVLCVSISFAGCFGNSPKVTDIDLISAFKTEYQIGESLNVSNGRIKVTFEDDTQKDLDVTSSMITGFDNTSVGQKSMTITYKEKTHNVNYTVTGAKFTEEKYLYFNASTNHAMLVYNNLGAYTFAEYYADYSTAAQEWTALQLPTYLQEKLSSANTHTFTQSLNNTDFHYYLFGSVGGSAVSIKIVSLDNLVSSDQPGINMADGYTRYIPVA